MKYLVDILLFIFIYQKLLYPRWKNNKCFLQYTLFYIYIVMVISVSLMPICTSLPFIFTHDYRSMQMIPFNDVVHGWGDYERQIILNIFMFMPMGFLLPITCKSNFRTVFIVCLCFSLFIEFTQPLLSPLRASDITDVITNISGGVLGYGCYAAIMALLGDIDLLRKNVRF